jgi:hypothetical protein
MGKSGHASPDVKERCVGTILETASRLPTDPTSRDHQLTIQLMILTIRIVRLAIRIISLAIRIVSLDDPDH